MPDMGTIATVLTVNAAPAQKGFSVYKGELASVQRQAEQVGRAAGSGGASRGLLELSRGVEDAAVGFGTNGLTGAIRGSLNNITAFATMVGGPLTGAIAGFTAAGVSVLANYFLKQPKAADDATAAIDRHREALERLHAERRREAEFKGALPGMGAGDIQKGQAERNMRVQELRDLLRANQQARERLAAPGREPVNMMAARAQMFGIRAFNRPAGELDEAAQKRINDQVAERNKLTRERVILEGELARLVGQADDEERARLAEAGKGFRLAFREMEQRELEERKRAFFARDVFGKDIDFDLKQGGGGLPGFGAPRAGTVEAQSAILRAGQNRDKGVSEKQLKKLEDIDRKLNDFLKKNALGLGVIALP